MRIFQKTVNIDPSEIETSVESSELADTKKYVLSILRRNKMISAKNGLKKFRNKWHSELYSVQQHNRKSLDAVYAFCQNELLRRQNVSFNSLPAYGYYERLHRLLTIYQILPGGGTLYRIGSEHDGGYVMQKPFSENMIAYSIGINQDVSWDLDMVAEGYQIYQYDHTIKKLPKENSAFHWKKIGITGGEETAELKNLTTLLRGNGHAEASGMVLKMDVEGYEWNVFANLTEKTLLQFDQIVAEIHNLTADEERELKIRALENITKTHKVIHIHANNYGTMDYCGDLMMPDTLEVTWLRKELCADERYTGTLPRPVDRRCDAFSPEILLGYWNLPE